MLDGLPPRRGLPTNTSRSTCAKGTDGFFSGRGGGAGGGAEPPDATDPSSAIIKG